jgi:hypothetical protein
MALSGKVSKFLNNNSDIVLFNRAMVIAGLIGLFSGASVAQLYSHDDRLENSIITLLTEYGFDIPVFCIMLYVEKRAKYRDPITGKSDKSHIKWDMKKLVISLVVSEGNYCVTKVSLQYIFLLFTEPYQASLISSIIGWISFFILINALNKTLGFFRKQNDT